jgi:membrane fusion protein
MSLFRSETEDARASAWLGRIILIRPISFAFLTAGALAIAFVMGVFFVLGEYTRKARVNGVLAPLHGVVRVIAQQGGVVQALDAREGMTVSADDALMTLTDPRASAARQELGDAVEASLRQRRRALELQYGHVLAAMDSEQSALTQRRSGIGRELEQLDAELQVQSRRLEVSRRSLDRWRALGDTGFVSVAIVDKERESALDQESRLEAARRTRLAMGRELDGVENEAAAARGRASAQLAAIDAQRAALEQERAERAVQHRLGVMAPVGGTIATVLVEPGQVVTPGTPLATLIPDDARLEAHLYAPSRSIGFVRVGQQVLLRYLAYPHQKFGSHGARVIAIARNPMAPGDLGFTPPDGSREPLYRIKVELDAQTIAAYGQREALQPGMQVEADILLDRRRLIEWIFEPLLSLAGRT